jgi:hypothetical protein
VPSNLLAAEIRRVLLETLTPLNVPGVTAVMVTVEPTDSNATDPTNSQLGAADIVMM